MVSVDITRRKTERKYCHCRWNGNEYWKPYRRHQPASHVYWGCAVRRISTAFVYFQWSISLTWIILWLWLGIARGADCRLLKPIFVSIRNQSHNSNRTTSINISTKCVVTVNVINDIYWAVPSRSNRNQNQTTDEWCGKTHHSFIDDQDHH